MGYRFYKHSRGKGTRLLLPMGFEFTFEKKYKPEHKHKKTIARLRRLGVQAHNDCGCLEINSPVFRFLEDAVDYWKALCHYLAPLGYVTRNKSSTGGGTHIHVGLSFILGAKNYALADRLARVVWNRPWLTWGFQEPDDDGTSNPICVDKDQIKYLSRLREYGCFGNKCYSVNFCDHLKTMEMRFFDTADSEEDLRAYILATNHLIRLARLRKEPLIPVQNKATLFAWLKNKRRGLAAFLRFVKASGATHSGEKLLQHLELKEEARTPAAQLAATERRLQRIREALESTPTTPPNALAVYFGATGT